ncbi:hypothetical protein FHL15_010427 [Xylaria flabelliformis]|uniref:Uncharacterized protein n=1 Tax=Xylaria flabelliformis TaxID=2512241 RepID=A0A553HL36_9PEZI|nr:hypothetical protein FHL15_010427 [Xylaria flabelliformis]
MEAVSTPRINAPLLPSYVGQNVIVVGKVLQLRGESALLEANGEINVILNLETHLMAGNGAQIIGKVNPDLSVKVYNAKDLGSNVATSYCSSSSVVYSSSSSVASVDNELSQLAIQSNASPSSQLATTQGTRLTRLNYQSTSRVRSTTVESHPSSNKTFSSTSSLNNELSQLVIEHDNTPSSQVVRAESYCSSSSEVFSSSSSLNNELSQIVIDHDDLPFSQIVRAQSSRSSSRGAFSSSSSLDNQLSQLAIEHDQFPSSQLTFAESYNSWQQRPATAASYCSSSSEALSSVPDSQDGVFSQPIVEEETPPSSQSTAQSTQPHQQVTQSTQSRWTDSSIPLTSVYESEADEASSAHDSDSPSFPGTPVFGSPSSTGKLSNRYPSSVPSPTPSTSHATPSTSTSSRRLYRTRSGGLASLAEIRQRREREEQALDIVLRGVMAIREARRPSKRSIPMRLNESGRWRISSIWEPWGR